MSSSSRETHKEDTLLTKFIYQDSKGDKYPIIVDKSSGKCYIWKKSSQTGRTYKVCMDAEVSRAVCKKLNIEYKYENRK